MMAVHAIWGIQEHVHSPLRSGDDFSEGGYLGCSFFNAIRIYIMQLGTTKHMADRYDPVVWAGMQPHIQAQNTQVMGHHAPVRGSVSLRTQQLYFFYIL
jgi:hypothetical protein